MINNDYVAELKLDFDINNLINIAGNSTNRSNYKKHQFHVEENIYLKNIQNEFPILGLSWNFYNFLPGKGIDVHIDSARTCALNIPLSGSEDSLTTFYEFKENMSRHYHEAGMLYYITDVLNVAFEFRLLKPTIIRTDVPHSVKAGKVPRSIISWGIHKLNFFEAKNYFKSMGVL